MSAKTVARLLCDTGSAYLLLALFLVRYLSICDGIMTESANISTDGNTTRPETIIPQGTIRGKNMVTRYNRTIFGFTGIPYAKPPVGDLRFKAPVSLDRWNGTLDASSDTEPCPQFNDDDVLIGKEDCLYLNVFTPQLPANNNSTLQPVMVYIIGGGFKMLDNSIKRFGPDFLLDKDIVLVTPNFRVGVLGFLTTGDEVAPGNYGLKDIVQALEWTQENIQYFGGDPDQVTLSGGSSGAISVHLLALSNLRDGLFHKLITQSGTVLSYDVNRPTQLHANRTIQLGKYLGCPTNTSTLLVNCLRGFNASQLVDTVSIYYIWSTRPYVIWTPSTEPNVEGALFTDMPANLYAAGKIRDLPWLVSTVEEEGLTSALEYYGDPDLFEDFLVNVDLALPSMVGYESIVNETAYTAALKSYYLNNLTADRNLLLTNLTHLLGDGIFAYPTYSAVQRNLLLAKSPVYFGSFEYHGTFSHTYLSSGGSTEYSSATHGDEMLYLFKDRNARFAPSDYEYSETDLVMVDTMVQLWTSFIINGNPTMVGSDNTTTWEPYSSLNNYLRIGNGSGTALEMKYDLLSDRMQFWDELTTATAASSELQNPLQVLLIALCFCIFSQYSL